MARIGRDHGGGLDAAAAQYGGERSDWLDLSTGINPEYYRIPRCCLLYTSPSPRDEVLSRMPSSA